MAENIPKSELLLTYSDLAVRWGRTLNALYVGVHRGYLPAPDYRIGATPVWTEATIRAAEDENPELRAKRKETK